MTEPRQQRAVKTREAIIYAAAHVFDECGYSGASISKIMDRAGVTQGGMYFHFKSKQELARVVMAKQQEFVAFNVGQPGLQRLIDLTFFMAHALQTNVLVRASVRLAVEQGEFGKPDATAYHEWVDQLSVFLYAARERGELLDDVDEREFATLLTGAFAGVQIYSNIATGREDLIERLISMWKYTLPALAPAHVRERLVLRPYAREQAA
ncbi:branched-chain amino acid aminotransferase [Streptomyces sp. CB00455]|uniref:ScbR family autoregulator-binding transcription factor n=1 Tax=Streptomyces sp. CB00455 TaxID=1703927 RepID=UPI00093A15D3|nr:ScbR family autoregulator-binding transcription factor [Streptomyces sp. CB00455]OKK14314.1 branched-chain amino acid aminotransferase [Streptomyces sp. CB00455]